MSRYRRRGFTLVEVLVVIAIIALISAVALPVVLPALNERKVSEAARLFQAVLAGARDAAIRANAPRGIRLLPDPIINGSNPQMLASNRFVPIEPAPDYSEGAVTAFINTAPPHFLQVYQAQAANGIPFEPTAWTYNIRQGDKIRFNGSGAYYTIAGPMGISPALNSQNPERYIVQGVSNNVPVGLLAGLEYLNLVNGVDDDGDGWIDEGFDGIDNDGDGIIDPGYNGIDDDGQNGVDDPGELLFVKPGFAGEFEQETFVGSQATSPPVGQDYIITRRAVVSPGSRETALPEGIVIDMTTWNARGQSPERSRVPVDPYTGFVDILVAPSGSVVQAGAGAAGISYGAGVSPTSNLPFYHFWLAERKDVVKPLWDGNSYSTSPYISNPNPNATAATPQSYLLPMPQGTPHLSPMPDGSSTGAPNYGNTPLYLTGERRLVSLFTKSGLIVTNSIEVFDANNVNVPFYAAQAGIKEQP